MIKFQGHVILTQREYDDLDERIKSIETQFVVKRDPQTNNVIQTLADVPIADRNGVAAARLNRHKSPIKGKTWKQLRTYLEATDGGRKKLDVQ